MDNKEANIDLLFRNGLKDYEVLPPVDVWNKILPEIRKKQRAVIFLRSAALIAVVLSVSFLAYRWSQEIVSPGQKQELALGERPVRVQNNRTNLRSTPITSGNASRGAEVQNLSSVQDTGYDLADEMSATVPEVQMTDGPQIDQVTSQPLSYTQIKSFGNLNLSYSRSTFETPDPVKPSYDAAVEKINRWTILALASPTYYMTPEMSVNGVSQTLNSSEQSRISYSGGVGFAYRLTKKLSIQSGLYYSSLGNEVDNINSFAGFRQYDYTKGDHNFEVLTSNGRIYTDNSDVFLLDNTGNRVLTMYTNDVFDPAKANLSYVSNILFQNFSYLEMPLILRYKVIDKSIDFNLIG